MNTNDDASLAARWLGTEAGLQRMFEVQRSLAQLQRDGLAGPATLSISPRDREVTLDVQLIDPDVTFTVAARVQRHNRTAVPPRFSVEGVELRDELPQRLGWPGDMTLPLYALSGYLALGIGRAFQVLDHDPERLHRDIADHTRRRPMEATADQIDRLTDLVTEHAKMSAALAISGAYVDLSGQTLPEQFTDPEYLREVLGITAGVNRIDQDLAAQISQHWEEVWREELSSQLRTTPELDTPGEQPDTDTEFYRLHGQSYPNSPGKENPTQQGGNTHPFDERGPDHGRDDDSQQQGR